MPEINNGTGAGMREFLERSAAKGDINAATANGLKAAVTKVLEIEDGLDQVDIKQLDVETILRRFATLQKANYTPGSMKTYQSRFRNAVAMYSAWLNNDPNWRKVVKARPAAERPSRSTKSGSSTQPQDAPAEAHVVDTDFAEAHDDSKPLMVTHQLPLRHDLIVRLTLPVDLTASDAARIGNFVSSLAFDDASTASPHVRAENEI